MIDTELPAHLGEFGLFVDGVWSPGSGERLSVVNPATEEEIATVPIVSDDELRHAIAATEAAAVRWAAESSWRRSQVLRAIAARLLEQSEYVAAVITAEQGKPLEESRAEVAQSVEYFDWFADEARRIYGRMIDGRTADRRMIVLHEPIGAAGLFTPNNFPLVIPARKIASALAAGCSVIIKPAGDTPLTVLLLGRICQEAGLPDGTLNIVTGDPAHIVGTIVAAPGIRKISLTGSVQIGQLVMKQAAETVKRMSMELGGNAPVVILPDADPVAAAKAVVASKFRNGGQVCVSPSRFLVSDQIYDAFVAEVVKETEKLVIGNGAASGTQFGPLVSARRLAAVSEMVEEARTSGATIAVGGARDPAAPRGHFYLPTVITDVTTGMRCMTDEPFGPILPIFRYRDVDEAIDLANSVSVGLAGYVFGGDVAAAERVARRLQVGMVSVNTFAMTYPEMPFGGIKDSGFGAEGGAEGIQEYQQTRYLNVPC